MRYLMLLLLSVAAFAQDGDELVTVPKKYVSEQGVQKARATQKLDSVTSYAGIGKEIGTATREALMGVVDVSDKFSKTDVGRFVLVMVAYKIVGQKALAIVLGIPIFLFGVGIWMYLLKRFMMPYQVLVKEDKTTKTKEYATQRFKFESGDAKSVVGVAFTIVICAWSIMWVLLIFATA
jgi:hypothetical protein